MKVYYIAGLLFAGIFGAFSHAHAGETSFVSSNASLYAQPTGYARNIQPAPQTRRVVRIEQPSEPRAVLVNGSFVMPDMTSGRVMTRQVHVVPTPKLNATPNLYRTTSQSNMPVMFTREALQAR